MTDPYRMVLVSIFALTCVSVLILFTKLILKKEIKPIFIVLLFSLLPVISILRSGSYESGDFNIQVFRTIDFYNTLSHGIMIPQWGSILNANYGHPVFIFTSTLQFYLMSFIHFLGFSFIASAKMVLIIFFILSGLTMFYFVKNFINEKSAVIASIFYLYTPYHLIDTHFRASFGDIIAFAFYPLGFHFSVKLINKPELKSFIFLSIVIFLLIIAHPITIPAIFFLIFFTIFYWFTQKNHLKNLITVFLSIGLGIILSSFYWIPLVFESKFTYSGEFRSTVLLTDFKELIFSPFKLGFLFQGSFGELSFLLGYTQIIVILFAIYIIFKSNKRDLNVKLLLFFITSCLILIFMITPYSKLIWDQLSVANSIQFSYRLLFIYVFIISIIAGISLIRVKNKYLVYLFCFITISYTILNWGHRTMIPEINDQYLITNVPYSTYQGEGATPEQPIWRNHKDPWMKIIPENEIEVISGSAEIKTIYLSPNKSEFLITNSQDLILKRNLFYFPGWNAYDNGNKIKINFENDGIIYVNLKPGIHKLEFVFENTIIRKNALILSFFGILTIILLLFIKLFKK